MAGDLRRRQSQLRWTAASYAGLERTIMLGFYAIRKLMDSFQPMLPKESRSSIELQSFPSTGKGFSELFWPTVEEHFDLSSPKIIRLETRMVCNQVIHSYVFSPWFDRSNRLEGLFFCSREEAEGKKGQPGRVFRLELQSVINLFEIVATRRGKWVLRAGPEKNLQVM